MQLRKTSGATLTLIGFLCVGCASFEPGLRFQELQQPRLPTAKAVQNGLEVSVEEFVTAEKSQMAFDTNLAASGVLAFLLKLHNTGTAVYVARAEDVKAFVDRQPLLPLSAAQAADQAATSEYALKALGWTVAAGPFAIILWPVTIGASAIHTHGVNKKIVQYFEGTKYQDALIGPKQTAMGFIYYKLPDGLSRVDNLTVEADAARESGAEKLTYNLSLPGLQITK